MALFDFTRLLGGAQGYTDEQRQRANTVGLLGAASALANAAAPTYGAQPRPTLLQGLLGGVQGYQEAGNNYLADIAKFYEPTRVMQQNAQQDQYIQQNPNIGQELGVPQGYPVTPELLNKVVPNTVAAKTAYDLSSYYDPRIAAAKAEAVFPYEQQLASTRAENQLQNTLAAIQAQGENAQKLQSSRAEDQLTVLEKQKENAKELADINFENKLAFLKEQGANTQAIQLLRQAGQLAAIQERGELAQQLANINSEANLAAIEKQGENARKLAEFRATIPTNFQKNYQMMVDGGIPQDKALSIALGFAEKGIFYNQKTGQMEQFPGFADAQAAIQAQGERQSSNPTALQQNYEMLVGMGIPQDQALSIASGSARQGMLYNKNTGEMEPFPGFSKVKVKPMPDKTRSALIEAHNTVSELQGLYNTFQDDFSALTSTIGEWQNVYGSKFGGDYAPQADWWRQYQRYKNIDRNTLFGGALTKGEVEQYNRQAVEPGMSPEAIRQNLSYQQDLLQKYLQKYAKSLAKDGFNPEAINEATDGLFSDTLFPSQKGGGVDDTRAQPNDPGIAIDGGRSPNSGVNAAGKSIPQGAIDKLRKYPHLAPDFEEKYGVSAKGYLSQ